MSAATTLKRTRPEPQWTIYLDDASGLRSILDAVGAVTQRVIFRVSKSESSGNYQLMFDGADVGMTCCVSARLHIDNVVFDVPNSDDKFTFCIDCKQLHIALDNPSCAHGSLMLQYRSDATIHCRMQDPEQLSHADCSELNTFVDGSEPIKLNDLEFDMRLEIDLSKLREMVKKATKCHSEHLRIQIYFRNVNNRQYSLVVFSVRGDAYHCQKFSHETSRDEDGSLRVRAVADGETDMVEDDVAPEYEAVFPVEKINSFIKILPCRMIVATIKQGMPLMMTHKLGGGASSSSTSADDSQVRFLIASINEND